MQRLSQVLNYPLRSGPCAKSSLSALPAGHSKRHFFCLLSSPPHHLRGAHTSYKNIAVVTLVVSEFLIFNMSGCFPQCWIG